MTKPRRFATIQTVATMLDVDPRTVRRWVASGQLNGYRAGKKLIRIDLDEVDEMMGKYVPNNRLARAAAKRRES